MSSKDLRFSFVYFTMEMQFLRAIEEGKVEKVKEIIGSHPDLDVNWGDEESYGSNAMTIACDLSHTSIVSFLLTHPDIDVNQGDYGGNSPFLGACMTRQTSCVRLLLKDSRVNVNEPNNLGFTPLWWAALKDNLDTIKWWIASGREMDLGKPGDVDKTDAIGMAKRSEKPEVASLLELFKENPMETRHRVRLELGYYSEMAAEVFALVVFVSDGLLQAAPEDQSETTARNAVSFFKIVKRLPLELQMVLCFRVVGSAEEIINGNESEKAFKELAKRI